ncbi:hypothetical protein HY3_07245 [Hyphomonas pacifica]|uniref:Uncharacterized protein n=1 Tax=Hyphomonas pacifica TaxID=1280941 RepID=A0A062TMQ7_9PROT|nr:hypothetical protein HY2_06275 [Hyphomonas pacifica]RAN35607.1 hypothetical protein HY3_07245 [Hyphomonas pacifica]
MTLSKTETRQALFSFAAAIPMAFAMLAAVVALVEYTV